MAHELEAAVELQGRVRDTDNDPKPISDLLDVLGDEERIEALVTLGKWDQHRLWRMVEGFRPIRLVDLVPAGVPALAAVRHVGRNSLPLFSRFEKRFYRFEGADPEAPRELGGANFQTLSPLTGPGYFTVSEDPNRPEIVIDYRRLPERAPSGWPTIEDNARGVSRLVYGFMVDTLRGVSEHVTIGSASRNGREMGTFFVLCREPRFGMSRLSKM
jgi:hypothetical protein